MRFAPGAMRQPGETDPELVVRGHRFILKGLQVMSYQHSVMVADLALGEALVYGPAVVMVVTGDVARMVEKVLVEESLKREKGEA